MFYVSSSKYPENANTHFLENIIKKDESHKTTFTSHLKKKKKNVRSATCPSDEQRCKKEKSQIYGFAAELLFLEKGISALPFSP